MAGSELMATLTVKAGSDEGTLRPLAFTGKVDIDIDPVNESIELSDIPDVLKSEDLVLDFYAPTLTAAVSTNAGIPVNVTADVVPVFTGGDGEKVSLNLAVPMSDDPASVETANYWVASVQPDDMPAGYQFIEADIRSLHRRLLKNESHLPYHTSRLLCPPGIYQPQQLLSQTRLWNKPCA